MAKYKITIELSEFNEDTISLRNYIISRIKSVPGADAEEVASVLKHCLDDYKLFVEKAKEFVNFVDYNEIDIYDGFDEDFDVDAFRELRRKGDY